MERMYRSKQERDYHKKSFIDSPIIYSVVMVMILTVMAASAVRMIILQNKVKKVEAMIGQTSDGEVNAYENGRYDYSYNPARVRYEQYFDNIYDEKSAITVFKDDSFTDVSYDDKVKAGEELIYEMKRYYNIVGDVDLEISTSMGDVGGIDHPYDMDITNFYNFSYYVIDEEERNHYKIVVNKQSLECENPWVYMYSIVHGFMHIYYHELISANDRGLYEMSANQVMLRDIQKLNLLAEELNAYEGKPEDIEGWLRSNSPFTYTEKIITEESVNFINNNRRLLLGEK